MVGIFKTALVMYVLMIFAGSVPVEGGNDVVGMDVVVEIVLADSVE
ncbi:hypothetical protein [Poriferisphaera sp. WC338]